MTANYVIRLRASSATTLASAVRDALGVDNEAIDWPRPKPSITPFPLGPGRARSLAWGRRIVAEPAERDPETGEITKAAVMSSYVHAEICTTEADEYARLQGVLADYVVEPETPQYEWPA